MMHFCPRCEMERTPEPAMLCADCVNDLEQIAAEAGTDGD